MRSVTRTVLTSTGPRTYVGRTLAPRLDTQEYYSVALSKGGVVVQFLIHRLVAKAFLPNPDNLPEVNHKNRVKTDASLDNLEWISQEDNRDHYQDSLCTSPITSCLLQPACG